MVSPSCTPTTRHRWGPTERPAGGCGGETLTGCAGVDDGPMGVENDDTGDGAVASGCAAAAIAAAEPATIGGASAATDGPADVSGAMGGAATDDAAHWSGGGGTGSGSAAAGVDGCGYAGGAEAKAEGDAAAGGTIGVPLRAGDPGGY